METGVVEIDQVLAGDGVDRRVFGLPGVRAVLAVDQPVELAIGDAADVVVAAGDHGLLLDLGQVDLVLPEGGMGQDVGEDGHGLVEILLEHGHPERPGHVPDARLHGRGQRLELLVDLVPGLPLRAARPQDGPRDGGQPGLARRLENGAGADHGVEVDGRVLGVFDEEELEAVRQFGLHDLGHLDRVEGPEGELVLRRLLRVGGPEENGQEAKPGDNFLDGLHVSHG